MRTSLKAFMLSGAAALLMATSVLAQDRNDSATPRVVYQEFGQGRTVLVVYPTPVTAPYALTGQAAPAADHWTTHSHWLEVGQTRVFIPATR